MADVTAVEATKILAGEVSRHTIRRALDEGKLQGRRVGEKRAIRVEVDSLRKWALGLNYRFDEALAQKLAK